MSSKKCYRDGTAHTNSIPVCEECGGEGIIRHDDGMADYYLYCQCVAGQALYTEDMNQQYAELFLDPQLQNGDINEPLSTEDEVYRPCE